MKKILTIGLAVFICLAVYGINKGSSDPDYSGLEIARHYQEQKNFLLAYKFLLIFKYSNLDRLKTPANSGTLKEIDKTLETLESYLSQSVTVIEIKRGSKGFTPLELDSIPWKRVGKLIVPQVIIK